MGYHTQFTGSFNLNKKLSDNHYEYLKKFSETRRIARNSDIAERMADVSRKKVKLPIGIDAQYFVGAKGFSGQEKDQSIIDYNQPPKGQPSLWCQWVPSADKQSIVWDGVEKFYKYVEWIQYLIDNFLIPWGYVLDGCVRFQGEERLDAGRIKISSNKVEVLDLKVLA